MANILPITTITSKHPPVNLFTLPIIVKAVGCLLLIYVAFYVLENPKDLTAPRHRLPWFPLLYIIPMYIFVYLEQKRRLHSVLIFKDFLQIKLGYKAIISEPLYPKDVAKITVIQQIPKKFSWRERLNPSPPHTFPYGLADYYYVLSVNISAKHAQQLKQKTFLIDTTNFTLQEMQVLIDWFNHHAIPIHHQLQPQGADIGYMPLILMLVGVIGGIAVWTFWDTIGSARHFVGNYGILWGTSALIALFISILLIKRQKKAYWVLTSFIATLFLTPMCNGILMKGYEYSHERKVKNQKLTPSYEFEFALDKNEAEKQTWQLTKIYQKNNSNELKPADNATQSQFRDLTLRATPNNPLWQTNINDTRTLKIPVYKIDNDWFFYPEDAN